MPRRIQMSRQHPWRADNPDAVIVSRPTRWGNPVRIVPNGGIVGYHLSDGGALIGPDEGGFFLDMTSARAAASREFREFLTLGIEYPDPSELAGRDLACWCPLDSPCHGDVLLELANPPEEVRS